VMGVMDEKRILYEYCLMRASGKRAKCEHVGDSATFGAEGVGMTCGVVGVTVNASVDLKRRR
jgi:hypothetical protein